MRVSLLKERNDFNMKVSFIFNLKCQGIIILMIYTIIIPACLSNGRQNLTLNSLVDSSLEQSTKE